MSDISAARRDATRVIVAAMQTGNLPWAANTPKNQKLDLLRGYINELAKQFIQEEEEDAKAISNSEGPRGLSVSG
jgi:hypothetical protein